MVYKTRNPQDKRAFQLYLTEEGNQIVPEIQKALRIWWDVLLADMPIEILEKSLETMTERADTLSRKVEK